MAKIKQIIDDVVEIVDKKTKPYIFKNEFS